jgi:BNR repeat-like domain
MLRLAFLLTFHLIPHTAVDFKQPQLAASGKLVAVTFGSGNSVYFSGSRDQGKTFSEPVKAGDAGVLMLGNHRGPRIAIASDAIVITAVGGAQGSGDLLTWRSLDGGRAWQPGGRVNDVAGAAREGLHAMAAGPDGRLYAVWLDLRHLTPGKPGTELYGAYSTDNGATWSKNIPVYSSADGSICQCCHPSVMFDAKGGIEVMWRNAIGGNRDMYLSRSNDGGRTFTAAEKLGGGSWKLNACPMDGGGFTVGLNGKVMTTWRRGTEVYLAPEGGAETLLSEGKNPSIAAAKEGLFVAWSGPDGVLARVPGKTDPVVLDREGGFVQLTSVPNGPVVAAWERKGTIQFHTLP